MSEAALHHVLVLTLFGLAALTFLALLVVTAPYGRHQRRGWGPTLPSRWGWVLMESPAVLLFAWIYAQGARRGSAAALAMLTLWQFHYLQRAFVFPLRMRGRGKRMPVLIALLAFSFNCLNAYVNARWISHLGAYPGSWLRDPRFLAGVLLFATGWLVNQRADAALFRLRAPGENVYRMPRGGLYERVACPNYLGELIEWFGWALLTWSLAGLAFAVYTAANLVPRALSHLRWYRRTFPDYPPHRKALIPYLW